MSAYGVGNTGYDSSSVGAPSNSLLTKAGHDNLHSDAGFSRVYKLG